MTDELECHGKGSFITQFVCAGPKSYGYNVYSPTKNTNITICKIKGITLNYETAEILNFEKIKTMILNNDPPLYISYKNFERTPFHEVITKNKKKFSKLNLVSVNLSILIRSHTGMKAIFKYFISKLK